MDAAKILKIKKENDRLRSVIFTARKKINSLLELRLMDCQRDIDNLETVLSSLNFRDPTQHDSENP